MLPFFIVLSITLTVATLMLCYLVSSLKDIIARSDSLLETEKKRSESYKDKYMEAMVDQINCRELLKLSENTAKSQLKIIDSKDLEIDSLNKLNNFLQVENAVYVQKNHALTDLIIGGAYVGIKIS